MFGRHIFLGVLSVVLFVGRGGGAEEVLEPASAKVDAKDANLLWYDILPLGVEGKGWQETKAPYDRLPAKAEKMAPKPVWDLSRQSAGLCVRFVSDATELQARWTLTSGGLALPHMPATGVSGLDLYVRTPQGWHWLGAGRPTSRENSVTLAKGIPPQGEREYLLYLPLYNGVTSVEIGIATGKKLAKAPPRQKKPIVFYGTSITQGGCASRPGMVHTALVGRHLDVPVINLGFSGSGKMEPAMADLFAELDPAVFVLDCLPNLSAQGVAERVDPFVRTLRKAHPQTPILLVEDRSYAHAALLPDPRRRNTDNRAALKKIFANLKSAGVENLHYLEGERLLGTDGEGTVDSSHPTDLGFMRQAEAFEKALKPLLK